MEGNWGTNHNLDRYSHVDDGNVGGNDLQCYLGVNPNQEDFQNVNDTGAEVTDFQHLLEGQNNTGAEDTLTWEGISILGTDGIMPDHLLDSTDGNLGHGTNVGSGMENPHNLLSLDGNQDIGRNHGIRSNEGNLDLNPENPENLGLGTDVGSGMANPHNLLSLDGNHDVGRNHGIRSNDGSLDLNPENHGLGTDVESGMANPHNLFSLYGNHDVGRNHGIRSNDRSLDDIQNLLAAVNPNHLGLGTNEGSGMELDGNLDVGRNHGIRSNEGSLDDIQNLLVVNPNHLGLGTNEGGGMELDGNHGDIPPANQPNKHHRNTKCGACKSRGVKCLPDCPFRPYFTPEQEVEWGKISRVFAYTNICIMMKDVPLTEMGDFFKNKIEEADIIWNNRVQGYSHVTNKLKAKIAQKDEEMKNRLAEKDREIAALKNKLHQLENQQNKQH